MVSSQNVKIEDTNLNNLRKNNNALIQNIRQNKEIQRTYCLKNKTKKNQKNWSE